MTGNLETKVERTDRPPAETLGTEVLILPPREAQVSRDCLAVARKFEEPQ